MEITGSGEVSKKDIQRTIGSNYKHNLKVAFQLSWLFLFSLFLILIYFYGTTSIGAPIVQLVEEDMPTAVGLFIYLLILLELLFITICFSIVKRSQFDNKKSNIGAHEEVLINSFGITIFSEKPSDKVDYRIAWDSVEEIDLKKQYLYIYTTSKSDLNLSIPSRYFSDDDLLRKINQIQDQEGEE